MSFSELKITTSNVTVSSFTTSLVNEQKNDNDEEFHFFEEYSDAERFLNFLFQLKIIGKDGLLLPGVQLKPFSQNTPAFREAAQTVLNTPQTLDKYSFAIKSLIHPQANIQFTGGFVRKHLIKDKDYMLHLLETLAGPGAKELLTSELLSEGERTLPDYDIKILCPKDATEQYLAERIETIAKLITQNPAESLIRNPLFPKTRVIFESDLRYSIIKVKAVELMFSSLEERKYLSTLDALRYSYHSNSLIATYENGWQTLVDLLAKNYRTPNPGQVDHTGLFKAASHFTRDHVMANFEELSIIRDNALKLVVGYANIKKQVEAMLASVYRSHHPKNPDILAALVINTSFYLQGSMVEEDLQAVFNNLITESRSPFFELIVKNKAPLKNLLAALAFGALIASRTQGPKGQFTLRWHCGKPAVQFHCIKQECTLLIPLTLNLEIPESLFPIFEEMIFLKETGESVYKFQIDGEIAHNLLKEESISKRYLGFLLLAVFQEEKWLPLLLKHLPEMIKFRKDPRLLSFLARVIPRYRSLIQGYNNNDLEWVLKLIATREPKLIKSAAELWKEVRVESGDLAVADALLPVNFISTLSLFRTYIKQCPARSEELPLMGKVLERSCGMDETELFPHLTTIDFLIGEVLQRHKTMEEWLLKKYIWRLIENGHFENAANIIYEAVPHLSGIQKCWKKWLSQAPSELITDRVKIISASLSPSQENLYWEAVEVLIFNAGTEQVAIEILNQFKEQKNERVSHIAQLKMDAIFKKGDPSASFERTYRHLLTPPLLQNNLERLIEWHLNKGEIDEALSLWNQTFSLENRPSLHELTIRIFDLLTNSKEQLARAFKALRKIDGLSLLTLEERAGYQVRIFNRLGKPTPALVEYMLDTMHPSLPLKIRLELTEHICASFSLVKTKSNHYILLKTLVEDKRFGEAEALFPSLSLNREEENAYSIEVLEHAVSRRKSGIIFERLEQLRDYLAPSRFRTLVASIQPRLSYQAQARLFLEYEDALEGPLQPLVFPMMFKKEISEKTAFSLFEKYPPLSSDQWKIVFREASPTFISQVWKHFNLKEEMAEEIVALALKMKGQSEWFKIIQDQMLPGRIFCHLFGDKEELFYRVCFIIIKELLPLKVKLLALLFQVRTDFIKDSNECKDWVDVCVQMGTPTSLSKAIDLLIFFLARKKQISFEPLTDALYQLIIATQDATLIDLAAVQFPLTSLLSLAEKLQSSSSLSFYQIITILEASHSLMNDELKNRFAKLYCFFLYSLPDKTIEFLIQKYPLVKSNDDTLKYWKTSAAKLLINILLNPETTHKFESSFFACSKLFIGPELGEYIEKNFPASPEPDGIEPKKVKFTRDLIVHPLNTSDQTLKACELRLLIWVYSVLQHLFYIEKKEPEHELWYSFARDTVYCLQFRFRERKELDSLLNNFIYSVPPHHKIPFEKHMDEVTEFLNDLLLHEIPCEHLLEYQIYIKIGFEEPPFHFHKTLPHTLQKVLIFDSFEAVQHAADIVNFNLSGFRFRPELPIKCFQMLFDQIPKHKGVLEMLKEKFQSNSILQGLFKKNQPRENLFKKYFSN